MNFFYSVTKNFTSKYKRLPISVKAAFWFTVCSVIQQAINFITVPIFTRILSTKDYGYWTMYQTWQNVFFIIITLNLSGGGFNNAMLKFKESRDSFVSSMVALVFVLVTIGAFILLILRRWIEPFLGIPYTFLFFMLIEMFFYTIYLLWAQKKRYTYDYKPLVVVTGISSILISLSGILVLTNIDNSIYGRVYSNVGAQVLVYSVLLCIVLKNGRVLFNKEFWRFAVYFNLPLMPHYLSQIVLGQCDRVMIGKMCGSEQAAFYSVAYSVANIVLIFVNSISAATAPWLYDNLSNNRYDKISKIYNGIALLIAAIIIIPILFGPEVILFLGPKEYQIAKWVIPSVAVSVYFQYLYSTYASIEFYHEKKSLVAIGSVITAIVNVVLNYIYIPKYGFVAAGYTTLFCYIVYAICHFGFSKYVLKKENKPVNLLDDKVLFGIGLLLIFFVLTSNYLYRWVIIRYMILLILIVVLFSNKDKIIKMLQSIKNNVDE